MPSLPNLRRLVVAALTGAALALTCQAQTGRRALPGSSATVLRATLREWQLKVVIVRNTLAPVVATSVNYMVGSQETPAGFPGHRPCPGAYDVPRRPRLERRSAGQYRQYHGGRFQCQHP